MSDVGLTARGKRMPETVEEWKYLYGLAEKTMLNDQELIRSLRSRVNTLEQKLEQCRSRAKRFVEKE